MLSIVVTPWGSVREEYVYTDLHTWITELLEGLSQLYIDGRAQELADRSRCTKAMKQGLNNAVWLEYIVSLVKVQAGKKWQDL